MTIRMIAPAGITRLTYDGISYDASFGYVDVPDNLQSALVRLGYAVLSPDDVSFLPYSGPNVETVYEYASGLNTVDASQTVTERKAYADVTWQRDIEYNNLGQVVRITAWSQV